MNGAPEQSRPAVCHLPLPGPAESARGQGAGQARVGEEPGTGVWEASVGRWPFQGQADVWSEQGRQTVSPEVALGLARGHREPAPPPRWSD